MYVQPSQPVSPPDQLGMIIKLMMTMIIIIASVRKGTESSSLSSLNRHHYHAIIFMTPSPSWLSASSFVSISFNITLPSAATNDDVEAGGHDHHQVHGHDHDQYSITIIMLFSLCHHQHVTIISSSSSAVSQQHIIINVSIMPPSSC